MNLQKISAVICILTFFSASAFGLPGSIPKAPDAMSGNNLWNNIKELTDSTKNVAELDKVNLPKIEVESFHRETKSIRISNNTAKKILKTVKTASREFPASSKRRKEVTLKTADEICNKAVTVEDLEKALEDTDEFQRQAIRMEHAGRTLNSMGFDVNADTLDGLYKTSRELTKFAPLVGSYGNLVNKACNVKEGSPESRKEFYLAISYFTAEVALIEAGIAYKGSSKAVRYMNNKAGMARLRGICGDECYSWALSEAHWAVRGSFNGAKEYILYESKNLEMPLKDSEVEEFLKKSANQATKTAKNIKSKAYNTNHGSFFTAPLELLGDFLGLQS